MSNETSNNIVLMIESKKGEFTSVEQIIADYFLSYQPVYDINQLAKKLAVSAASITRFCHKIGLHNYKELIFLYRSYLDNRNKSVPQDSIDVVNSYMAIGQRTNDIFDEKSVVRFCDVLYQNRVLFFWGLGFNSFVGQDIEFRFARFGKIIQRFSDHQSISLNANFLKQNDVLLISSVKAADKSILESIKVAHSKGVKILLLTANKNSKYIQYCDEVMYIASFTPEESLGNISPQVPVLIGVDIIYSKYISLHGSDISQWTKSEMILKDYKQK